MYPIVRSLPGSWARAAIDHAGAPPISAMKSRRLIRLPDRTFPVGGNATTSRPGRVGTGSRLEGDCRCCSQRHNVPC